MNFRDIVKTRRAVNYFDTNKSVPENLIKEMIEIASNTPSSYNLQPWSLMILKDQEEKARLRKLAFDQPKVTEAPYIFIILADRDGWKHGSTYAEKNFIKSVESGKKKAEEKASKRAFFALQSKMKG